MLHLLIYFNFNYINYCLVTSLKIVRLLYESGALQDVLHLPDVLARVALARLCHAIARARSLDGNV